MQWSDLSFRWFISVDNYFPPKEKSKNAFVLFILKAASEDAHALDVSESICWMANDQHTEYVE